MKYAVALGSNGETLCRRFIPPCLGFKTSTEPPEAWSCPEAYDASTVSYFRSVEYRTQTVQHS